MFDLLKKKISGFVDKLSGREGEEDVPAEEPKKPVEKKTEAKPVEKKPEKSEEKPKREKPGEKKVEKTVSKKEVPKAEKRKKETLKVEKKKEKPETRKKEEPAVGEKKTVEKEAHGPVKETPEKVEKPELVEEKKPSKVGKEEPVPEVREEPEKKGILERILWGKKEEETPEVKEHKEKTETPPEVEKEKEAEAVPEKVEEKEEREEKPPEHVKEVEKPKQVEKKKPEEKEKELQKKVKKGIFASVTETITGESEIREEEVTELLDELELGMLESDVALSVAEEIKVELGKRIVGSKVKRGQTAGFVRDSLQDILVGMFRETPGFELNTKMEGGEKPYKVLIVGPNGAGKTTTIAKIVKLLQKKGKGVCVAASDTFRAAAVEQLVHHGNKLGINVIHGAYGSDPASIAFDAVNHAKAHNLDAVLIDTAGRQETNLNLINQLKKMDRVINPDLKIYVGESIAGNAMVEQISAFNEDIGLDGVVLTKLDCDAKGGTVISVSRVAKLPILYVGTGQGYDDLEKFDAEKIVGEILS